MEFEEWYGQEPIQVMMILMQPSTLKSFWREGDELPALLQQMLTKSSGDPAQALGPYRFHQSIGNITSLMQQTLVQILHSPYRGMMQQMYLESKALELLTLQLTQWSEGNSISQRQMRLRPDDIERLHHARDILMQQMESPPLLLELAQQVGMDDCKLKRGFRQLFGKTVFGYLHDARLERSRQLLTTGTMSVTEVAYTIGYNSLPSFSKAFRKRFGRSPLTYTSALRLG
ncbi:MAG: helix-turn-helix transcriptional regulator [Cyanothece sp. SIO1E1]|nr:helix-turn-helix transcriptional regulator [Cyanothece sp. SIO1E1]